MRLIGRRKRRDRPKAIRACPHCGSQRIERKRLWDGPVTYEHDTMDTQLCLDCGKSGIPLLFETDDGRMAYQAEKQKDK